ncbi:MAG: hypothetical protein RL736_565 [Pseudomonadota bacterium]|jgi:hypothetical protein
MAYTTTISKTASTSLDFNYASTSTVTGSAKLSINETIPTGTTNVLVNFNFSVTSGVFLAMATDIVGYPLTIKTNSSSAPDNGFILTNANQVIFDDMGRALDSYADSLVDITALYVSNTGVLPASLRIDSLFDGTPGV